MELYSHGLQYCTDGVMASLLVSTVAYRLLPAVTGEWFYSSLGEKYRNDVSAVFGSDIVRSSIRRYSSSQSSGIPTHSL